MSSLYPENLAVLLLCSPYMVPSIPPVYHRKPTFALLLLPLNEVIRFKLKFQYQTKSSRSKVFISNLYVSKTELKVLECELEVLGGFKI